MDEFAPVLFICIEVLILIMITPNEVLITKNLWIMSPLSPSPFLFHSPSHTSSNPKIVKIPDLKWLMHTNKRSLQAVVIAIQQLQSICLFLTLLSLPNSDGRIDPEVFRSNVCYVWEYGMLVFYCFLIKT